MADGGGADPPMVVGESGMRQHAVPYRFDLIPVEPLFRIAEVLARGAEVHGVDNWRKGTPDEHYNRLIAHAMAWKRGDEDEDHLTHIACRALMLWSVVLARGDGR